MASETLVKGKRQNQAHGNRHTYIKNTGVRDMITVEHVTLAGNMTFEKVRLFTANEVKSNGLPMHFEDATILLENNEGNLLLPSYNILLVRISSARTKVSHSMKVRRISISGSLLYSDCFLVNPKKHKEAGVPLIFRPYEQFSFACKDGLFVTTDFNVQAVQL